MTGSNNDPSCDDHTSQSEENVYREIHEWGSPESLSETVVMALANFEEVEATEMDPLYEHVDPDALEELFDTTGDGFRAGGRVSFTMNDNQVTIHSHGEFAVVAIRNNCSECSDYWNITTETAFRSALQTLVQLAAQNGVSVNGGLRVKSPSTEFPDWEVVITELAKQPNDDDHPRE